MDPFFVVQAGDLKNRKIFFIDSKKGHSNYTSGIIKKAVFDKLESESMQGKIEFQKSSFIDLFAGSAQMAVEAISRGFNQAHCFEIDSKRYRFMKKNLSGISKNLFIYNKDGFRYYHSLIETQQSTLVYFLDPPYSFWDEQEKMNLLISKILELQNCKKLYVQSPKEINCGINYNSRRFGNNYILEFN